MHTGGATGLMKDGKSLPKSIAKTKVDGGKYRCGAHHYWMVGRSEGKKKNPGGSRTSIATTNRTGSFGSNNRFFRCSGNHRSWFHSKYFRSDKAHQRGSSSKTIDTIVQPPSIPNGIEKPKVNCHSKLHLHMMSLIYVLLMQLFLLFETDILEDTIPKTQLVMDSINAGKVGIFDKDISINEDVSYSKLSL